jgi:hypothetical protein
VNREQRQILARALREKALPRDAAFGEWLLRVAHRVSTAYGRSRSWLAPTTPRVSLEHLAHGVAIRLIHGPAVADGSLLDAIEAAMLAAEFEVAHALLVQAGLADPRTFETSHIAQINTLLRRAA